jgi:hypothetical protein
MDAVTTGQAMARLKHYKRRLRPQQYTTLRGQILAGDIDGALQGLRKLLKRGKENAT